MRQRIRRVWEANPETLVQDSHGGKYVHQRPEDEEQCDEESDGRQQSSSSQTAAGRLV